MSIPVRQDFQETQGDTFRAVLPLLDFAGDPFDFTGATVRGQVKTIPVADDSELLAEFVIESLVAGEMTIYLAPATTAGLVGTFAYDLEVEDAAGDIDTVYYGEIQLDQQVTFEVAP